VLRGTQERLIPVDRLRVALRGADLHLHQLAAGPDQRRPVASGARVVRPQPLVHLVGQLHPLRQEGDVAAQLLGVLLRGGDGGPVLIGQATVPLRRLLGDHVDEGELRAVLLLQTEQHRVLTWHGAFPLSWGPV
jgi:hypothetical protein